jgi:ATP/maltotriose-dependent transcriptional regulator MalT
MEQFYPGFMIIGVLLIIISLTWFIINKKKLNYFMSLLEKKKDELSGIISDAEQMIEELNRFSDYVVTQIDLKNEQLWNNFNKLDKLVKQKTDHLVKELQRFPDVGMALDSSSSFQEVSTENKAQEKIIPFNNRYRDIVNLANKGLTDTEIARKLKMGKGEIQLILEICK